MKAMKIGVIGIMALGLTVALGQAGPKKILGVSIPSADHGWTAGIVFHANRAKVDLEKKYPNLTVIVKTAKDAAEQASQIQDLVTVNKIDALVILPQESGPLTNPVKVLHDKGLFVTVVDRGLTDPSAQDAYVAGNNVQFGRQSGQWVCQKQAGKAASIVIMRGIPTVIDNQRTDAFAAAIKKGCANVTILDKKYANWNRDDGFKVMQDYLTRFKTIDGVWTADDDVAVGAQRAIDQSNRKDIKWLLGGAGSKDYIKKVMDGDPMVSADVTYPPAMIYTAATLTAQNLLGVKKIAKSTIIPSVLITTKNAKLNYFPTSPY